MIKKTSSLFALLALVLLVPGCLQPIHVPIDTLLYPAQQGKQSQMLIVYLPGRGDAMTAIQEEGLIDELQARGIAADVMAVNAHMGYYMNGTILVRIKEDVIDPARAKGYHEIWLAGDSLGGYGSLAYSREHPREITGVVLLGPFLGEQKVIDEVEKAGDIRTWVPSPIREDTEDVWDKRLWLWIKERVQKDNFSVVSRDCSKEWCPPAVFLGFGTHDRFNHAQRFFASFLPKEQVIEVSGGHDWSTWKKVWAGFLDRKIFDQVHHRGPAAASVKP